MYTVYMYSVCEVTEIQIRETHLHVHVRVDVLKCSWAFPVNACKQLFMNLHVYNLYMYRIIIVYRVHHHHNTSTVHAFLLCMYM